MTTDDSREQAIRQASDVMYEFANGGLYDPMGLAGALESAGLLAGTANTTVAQLLPVCNALARANAEVAKLRAELHANDLLAGDLVLEANRDRDRAVADLAALRDKVRALHSHESDDEGIRCRECWNAYPCDTIALLTDGGQS